MAAVKLWSGVELTEAALWNEMRAYQPARLGDLHLWTPLLDSGNVKDYSGAGRDWTLNGSVDT